MAYFAPYIDSTGIHLPTYEDRLQDLLSSYRSIFGVDAVLDPSVPDYQLLSVIAKALDDMSALVLSAYNSRNPALASGQALDLLLPMYGLQRQEGESDASCRARIKLALAARGAFFPDALEAAIRQVPNVTHVKIRVNDTAGTVDSVPPYSIMCLVNNGNANELAKVIWNKKPPGIPTAGSISRTVTDSQGFSHTVKLQRPTLLSIYYRIELTSYAGYDAAAVEPAIRSLLFRVTNTDQDIGEDLIIPQLYGKIYQAAGEYASTFAVTSLQVSGSFGTKTDKVEVPWNNKVNLNNSDTDVVIVVSGQ